jgi:hypothetical protein
MYSTCLFCHAGLGSNESVEHFPVGRRLVFDGARGRLWVVCRRCERWNLTPLEERWEAIEECDRLFAGTRLRVSTDNIGLARVRDGLELVRIGLPLRPELAAWRYGDQFGRRRRRHLVYTGAGVAAAAGLIFIGPVTGIIAGSSWGLWNVASTLHSAYQRRRVRARLVLPEHDAPVAIRLKQLMRVSVIRMDDDWALRIPFEVPAPRRVLSPDDRLVEPSRWTKVEETALVRGDSALQAASKLLPAINASGARRRDVEAAVELIGTVSEPSALFARYAARPGERCEGSRWTAFSEAPEDALATLPAATRLALEMATHEASERRALEGELALLEAAWREAEEIAGIADDLFVSDDTRRRLAELRDATRGTTTG